MKKKAAVLTHTEQDYKNMVAVLDAAQKVRFERDIRFIIRRLTEWVDFPSPHHTIVDGGAL